MTRPGCIVHWREIETLDDAHYPGSDELLSIGAPLGSHTGLTQIGVHHERLPPGRRTSWPHAERDEDELVFVLEGYPLVWLDGEVHELRPGDAVGFPRGTGQAHTFINDTDREVRLLVVGQASSPGSKIHYPTHPDRNASIGERHWGDAPRRPLGQHGGEPRWPGRERQPSITREERLEVPTLQTERLILRPHEQRDAEAIHDMRVQPGALDHMTLQPPASLAQIEAMVARFCSQNGWSTVGWTAVDRASGRFVGMLGVLRIDAHNASAEVGYEVHRAWQRQGLAREAVAAAVEHAFGALGLHRLVLYIDPQNQPSIRVAESLGFAREGLLRQHERHQDGRWLDSLIYARINPGQR